MTLYLARHGKSGEAYLLSLDEDGKIDGTMGPLEHEEFVLSYNFKAAYMTSNNIELEDDCEWAEIQPWNHVAPVVGYPICIDCGAEATIKDAFGEPSCTDCADYYAITNN